MKDFQVVVIKEEKEENLAFPMMTREEELPAEIGTGEQLAIGTENIHRF